MANTLLMKTLVEPYVRDQLAKEFGQPFTSRFLPLPGGGRHEFDAVADDRTIVTSIKSSSGLTSGGKRPGAKIQACYAELYYLVQIEAPSRLLVMTNPEFFGIFERDSRGRLAPGIDLKLVRLPAEIQGAVDEVTRAASAEMVGDRRVVEEAADLVVSGDVGPDGLLQDDER
jgi:hypothetical protein